MNSRSKLLLTAAVAAIFIAPVTRADQLKSASTLPYSVSLNQGLLVLEIVNTYWTTSSIPHPGNSELALAKVRIKSLLAPLQVSESNVLLQKSVVSLALTKGGWAAYRPPAPPVRVPEASGWELLSFNMALVAMLVFVFRRRILQLS